MKQLVCTLAMFAVPFVASATEREGERFTAQITFDRAALDSEKGAEKVLAEIERQAREVCTVRRHDRETVDEVCVKDIVAKVVAEIGHEALLLASNDASPGRY